MNLFNKLLTFFFLLTTAVSAATQEQLVATWSELCKGSKFTPSIVLDEHNPVCRQFILAIVPSVGTPTPISLFFYKPLLERFTERELRAILAHEFSHFKNNDGINRRNLLFTISLTGLASCGFWMNSIKKSFLSSFENATQTEEKIKVTFTHLLKALLPIATFYGVGKFNEAVFYAYTRYFEKRADRTSVDICNDPEALISSIEKIVEITQEVVGDKMNIRAELEKDGYKTFYPPLTERYRLIREYAKTVPATKPRMKRG